MQQQIQTDSASITIETEGAYLLCWKVDGKELLYQGSSKKRTGIPILFPYFGEGGTRRKHGFGRDSIWQIQSETPTSITLYLNDKQVDEQAKKEYPFLYEVSLTMSLASNKLVYTMNVKNNGTSPLPLCPGIHPYFPIEQNRKKEIVTDGIPGFDAYKINWDSNPPDNRYDFDGKIKLHFPTHTITIEDISNNGPKAKHLAVWSQTPQQPDYNFVCFEPTCGLDNMIDTSPLLIDSGSSWSWNLRFSVDS